VRRKVFIDGSGGTAGLQIRQRLEGRNDIELLQTADKLSREKTQVAASDYYHV